MQSIDRTQFLRGKWQGQTPARPPWSIAEPLFVEKCSGCGDCIEVCPQKILEAGRGRYPKLNFNFGECTFCGDCVDVCKTDALDHSTQPIFSFSIDINKQCLAHQGIECRACGDSCEAEAITFKPTLGRPAQPVLDTDSCTRCGACLAGCPVDALTIASESRP